MKKIFISIVCLLVSLVTISISPWSAHASTIVQGCSADDTLSAEEISALDCLFTRAPTLFSPVSSHSYDNSEPLSISFLLPDMLTSGSLYLTFTPAVGSPIVLQLRDAAPEVTNTFSLPLSSGFEDTVEVIYSSASSIPDGVYTVTLSYRDNYSHPPASAEATNVTIGASSGTLHFHIFTDSNRDGIQDTDEDDGFEGATATIANDDSSTRLEFDDNGDIDESLTTGTYTLTLNNPSNTTITSGTKQIAVVISPSTTTDVGVRGIVHRPTSTGGRSHVDYGTTTSSHQSSEPSISSSAPRTNNSHTTITTTQNQPSISSLPAPQTHESACLHTGSSSQFSDIANNSAIAFLSALTFSNDHSQYLIHGYANGTFGPNHFLTRFELLKIAMGSNCIGGGNNMTFTHTNSHFSDVAHDSSEQSRIIGEAFSRGIITGIGDHFYPDEPVTFAEMIKMLLTSSAYFNQGQPISTLQINVRQNVDSTFSQPLEYARRLSLLPTTFTPNNHVSRLEMAQLLMQYIQAMRTTIMAN